MLVSTGCTGWWPAATNPSASRAASELAWVAWRSQASSASHPRNCAATRRCLESRWPVRLRCRSGEVTASGRNTTMASAATAPHLVAPRHSTSTPDCQVSWAGVAPVAATALANRAPSMCTPSPSARAICASAQTSSAW